MIRKINAPSYSIPLAPKLKLDIDPTPGPGSYRLRSRLDKGILFTKSPKVYTNTSFAAGLPPGPGKYNILTTIGKGPKPVITSRKSLNSLERSPGPADYSPRVMNKSLQFTFPKQTESFLANVTPGPASYNPKIVAAKSPSATIGNSPRSLRQLTKNPGPGSYELKSLSSCKIVSFTKAKKIDKIELSPGPGDYSPKITYKTPEAFPIRSKFHSLTSIKRRPEKQSPRSIQKLETITSNSGSSTTRVQSQKSKLSKPTSSKLDILSLQNLAILKLTQRKKHKKL